MPVKDGPTAIKKYANRRLYNTGTSSYVTLEDLADMVKQGEDFTVQDAKSGEDITHTVLTQIIFEQEAKSGQGILPVSFLREIIGYYGDQMQAMLPGFLDNAMKAFSEQQAHMREQMDRALYENPLKREYYRREETVRRAPLGASSYRAEDDEGGESAPAVHPVAGDLDDLRRQLRVLQNRIDNL
ncbi:polyhydroxyalkanoate synthesis repressor PhaR [Martelella lutilitoris]|uniref:Polyhydroxyalkanoate synthesis repressor PhaR n=1 Tax=Martelella lutilitoris TaxID=2583532 RepID=A0A7T7HJK8_9HYPH|nr:polyhydroxyalkanoate synthesis repressor PhaR [Martelella lutilitoris]QQM30337.1 polyhydroxyalkanoate synthesis repressor PhaR [Martelella lutilitoris]